jgi:hypothetical protein
MRFPCHEIQRSKRAPEDAFLNIECAMLLANGFDAGLDFPVPRHRHPREQMRFDLIVGESVWVKPATRGPDSGRGYLSTFAAALTGGSTGSAVPEECPRAIAQAARARALLWMFSFRRRPARERSPFR